MDSKIEQYLKNADHYYDNSQKLFNEAEFSKSGELLWGALAETVKALSLLKFNKPIRSHLEIRKFLREYRDKFSDNSILLDSLESPDKLHINFYETYLEDSQFKFEYDKTKALLMYFKGLVFEKN